MKKIVLFALVAVGLNINSAVAQSFTLAHDTTSAFTGSTVDVHNTITNVTGNSINMTWRIVTSATTLAPGWLVSGVCDNNSCYPWAGDVSNGNALSCSISGMSSMDGKVQYDATAAANGTVSWVTIRYTEGTSSKFATFIATKVPTGINTVVKSDDNVVLYPNPAKDDLNVVFDMDADVKNIAVYNLIGKAVSIYKVNGNSAKLNVSNIPSGIYFVRLLDGQGRIVATRKFTH